VAAERTNESQETSDVQAIAMLKLALTVVAIALPDCINPSLIGGELFISMGSHPRRRSVAFTLGVLAVTFGFGLAFALGLGDLILSVVPKPGATVKYALITAAGAALAVGGIAILIRRDALTGSTRNEDQESHGSPALIGAGLGGFELLTAFPYFAAIALIIGSGVSDTGKLFLLLLYCLVYALPLIAIAAAFAVMGDRAEAILRPVGKWLFGHWPVIVGPLTLIIGLAVLAFGIVQLTST
jgi:cytochrome c biogenesis protein CcdA